jgi:hypothetical protein
MSIDQLQLRLIPEGLRRTQPLPTNVRNESIALIARMLLDLVRGVEANAVAKEARDESR